jgi:hypothetical protein
MINKTSKLMTRCTGEGQVTLLHESIQEVMERLEQANGEPDLIVIVKEYLWAQGSQTMESCITTG